LRLVHRAWTPCIGGLLGASRTATTTFGRYPQKVLALVDKPMKSAAEGEEVWARLVVERCQEIHQGSDLGLKENGITASAIPKLRASSSECRIAEREASFGSVFAQSKKPTFISPE
jgi:hypothetical protein